jgi:hypothetical protein
MEVLPNYWEYKSPAEARKDVSVFTPYWGPDQTRGYGDGSPRHHWELGNADSAREDAIEMKAFWGEHFPGIQFYMYDPEVDETRVYTFDSNYGFHYNPGDSHAWSVRIKEAWPYTRIAGTPPEP